MAKAHFRRVFGSAVPATGAIAFALAIGQANAAPLTVDQIANYQAPDRAAVLEAGARSEGSLLVYTVGSQNEPLMKRFREKYPFIRLEVFRAAAPDITRRILEEYKAKKPVADTIELNDGGTAIMREAGALQPLYSPEMRAFAEGAVEPGRQWVSSYESYKGLGFNTKYVSPDEAPKTLDDLLDPKWKGKMALATRAMPTWIGGVLANKPESFVRQLGKQDFTIYVMGGRAVANLVVSGESPLSPLIYNSHMFTSAGKGAPVQWRALDGVYANTNVVSVLKNAPHPHAAMMMIDFMLSPEAQLTRIGMGYASARTDVESPGKPPKVFYLSQRPDYGPMFDRWTQLGEQVFGKGKAHPTIKDEGD